MDIHVLPPETAHQPPPRFARRRPRRPLTHWIIGANVLLFLAMVLQGATAGLGLFASLLRPDFYLLLHAGAQSWPLVIAEGEWWRCLTYAYTHGGLIHLAFNMVALYQVGRLLEREVGPAVLFSVYTLTALTATLAGLWWHPTVSVVGASGSLFGLIGFAVGIYHRQGDQIARQKRNFMVQWAIFALLFGFVIGADNAGHLGGAAGGLVLGFLLPLSAHRQQALKPAVNLLALICGGATLTCLSLLVVSWLARWSA